MYYLLLILFLLIKLINNQELFTSSAELQQLINIENKIPKIIENYIILENERLENLKDLAENYLKIFQIKEKHVFQQRMI
ncbi:Fe2OG dioxygenase domain-containing protein [Meloidogyne graminicola]|uniref:Fe2OG dioxygenase domain-containing protein n=1 Tax=Meloidogyne graminicola TaxID=189291 RepID=A0A8S9Z8J4_9BILA|nr:Fe2OG dioxygenase domain-containing protein [Meloidogyne graminicola]